MKIVEISASLGNDLKRYNVFTEVSMKEQPFTKQASVLYGVTKPTDIVQTNAPTNILIDVDGNPIDDSEPVYFGIRVYPFISMKQDFECNNNTISYGELFGLSGENYFTLSPLFPFSINIVLPDTYEGKLYPQPEFFESVGSPYQPFILNHQQAMQQFINDCVFPTKPNIDIPGQSQSNQYIEVTSYVKLPYFSPKICVLSKLNQRYPSGVLNLIQDVSTENAYKSYMAQFDGQNLNFKFGMSVNSDFAPFFTEPSEIYLPFLYRTYGALLPLRTSSIDMGVIMQCLLYDSNGNVISA